MSSCGTDQTLIQQIVENAILRALETGRLQAGLKNCAGTALSKDTPVPSCQELPTIPPTPGLDAQFDEGGKNFIITYNGANITVPLEPIYTALHLKKGALNSTLTAIELEQGDGTKITVDVSQFLTAPELTEALATKQDQLLDCEGNALQHNAKVVTCEQLGIALESCASQKLKNCAGQEHEVGAQVPSCLEMGAAIANAIASIAPDKYLAANPFVSYDPVSDIMTLAMSDGSTVQIPFTQVLADAVAGKQGQLKDCLGVDIPAGANVVTCWPADVAVQTYQTNDGTAVHQNRAQRSAVGITNTSPYVLDTLQFSVSKSVSGTVTPILLSSTTNPDGLWNAASQTRTVGSESWGAIASPNPAMLDRYQYNNPVQPGETVYFGFDVTVTTAGASVLTTVTANGTKNGQPIGLGSEVWRYKAATQAPYSDDVTVGLVDCANQPVLSGSAVARCVPTHRNAGFVGDGFIASADAVGPAIYPLGSPSEIARLSYEFAISGNAEATTAELVFTVDNGGRFLDPATIGAVNPDNLPAKTALGHNTDRFTYAISSVNGGTNNQITATPIGAVAPGERLVVPLYVQPVSPLASGSSLLVQGAGHSITGPAAAAGIVDYLGANNVLVRYTAPTALTVNAYAGYFVPSGAAYDGVGFGDHPVQVALPDANGVSVVLVSLMTPTTLTPQTLQAILLIQEGNAKFVPLPLEYTNNLKPANGFVGYNGRIASQNITDYTPFGGPSRVDGQNTVGLFTEYGGVSVIVPVAIQVTDVNTNDTVLGMAVGGSGAALPALMTTELRIITSM